MRVIRVFGIAVVLVAGVSCERNDRAGESERTRAKTEPPSVAAAVVPVSNAKRPTLEPCRLLTLDEAGAVLRGPATASPFEKVAYASSCIWETREPRRGLQVMTSTAVQLRADESLRAVDGDTPEKRFAQVVQSQAANGSSEAVPNVGDAALWSKQAGQLWILKRGRGLVTVSLHGDSPPPDAFETCLAVARKIMPRL
jgi:hypothetical protein